jgi:hypothetical protein
MEDFKRFRVQTARYVFALEMRTMFYGREPFQHTISFGDRKQGCVTLSVTSPVSDERMRAFSSPEVANLEYHPECTLEGELDRGKGTRYSRART